MQTEGDTLAVLIFLKLGARESPTVASDLFLRPLKRAVTLSANALNVFPSPFVKLEYASLSSRQKCHHDPTS